MPALKFRRSQDYLTVFRQFAQSMGYEPYWTHHWTGQARGGVAILVQAGIEVRQVLRGLDLDGEPQFEGRVLALQLQGFWVVALYMPHRDDFHEHIRDQPRAWMERCPDPVIVAGDMNAVIAPDLRNGIRVHTTGLYREAPSDYFSSEWDEKKALFTEKRRAAWAQWMDECGLRDVDQECGHTSYFRIAFALRGEDGEVSASGAKRSLGPVFQRRMQVATVKIDGFLMNTRARDYFTVRKFTNDLQLDPDGSSEQVFQQGLTQSLGSDHAPIMVRLESQAPDLWRRTESSSYAKRVALLVTHTSKVFLGLTLSLLLRGVVYHPVDEWRRKVCWNALPVDQPGPRRWWQRLIPRAVTCMVLRYWHLRRLESSGPLVKHLPVV